MKKFTAIFVSLLLALTATITASASVLSGAGDAASALGDVDLSSVTDALSGIDVSSLLNTSDFDVSSILGGLDVGGMFDSLGSGMSESDSDKKPADDATPAEDNGGSGSGLDIGSMLGDFDIGSLLGGADIGSLLGGLGDFDIGSLLGDFDIGSLLGGGDMSGILDTVGGLFNSESGGKDEPETDPTTNPSSSDEPTTGSIVDTGDC